MQAKERARGALVDPTVHAQLAAPRAALRQAALEELAELAPTLLVQHAPAIAARLEDRQMAVRRAALHALRRLPAAALFDYLPAILARLEDKDDEVRDSAHRRSSSGWTRPRGCRPRRHCRCAGWKTPTRA